MEGKRADGRGERDDRERRRGEERRGVLWSPKSLK